MLSGNTIINPKKSSHIIKHNPISFNIHKINYFFYIHKKNAGNQRLWATKDPIKAIFDILPRYADKASNIPTNP